MDMSKSFLHYYQVQRRAGSAGPAGVHAPGVHVRQHRSEWYRLFAFLRMENYPGIRTQIFGSLIEIPMNLLGKPMNFSTNFPGRPVS